MLCLFLLHPEPSIFLFY